MTLFLFELKKIIFSRRFQYLSAIILLLIGALYVRNILFQDLLIKEQQKQVDISTREVQSHLRAFVLQQEKDSENMILSERITHLSTALDALYEWKPLLQSEDWQARLQTENTFLTALLSYKETGGEFSLSTPEMERTLAWNDQLLRQGIEPSPENYGTSLPNFMKQITDIYVNIGAIVLLLLLIGDLLTIEFEQGSIRFLYTQPVKKSAILHAKSLTAITIYLFVTAAIFIFTWLLGLTIGKPGSFSYPVMIDKGDSFTFIPIFQYIQWSLSGTSCIILLVIPLCMLISLYAKNAIITLLSVMVIIIGGYFSMQAVSWSGQPWIDPFHLLFTGRTIQTISGLWIYSVPITLLLALLIYLFALLKMKRTVDIS